MRRGRFGPSPSASACGSKGSASAPPLFPALKRWAIIYRPYRAFRQRNSTEPSYLMNANMCRGMRTNSTSGVKTPSFCAVLTARLPRAATLRLRSPRLRSGQAGQGKNGGCPGRMRRDNPPLHGREKMAVPTRCVGNAPVRARGRCRGPCPGATKACRGYSPRFEDAGYTGKGGGRAVL